MKMTRLLLLSFALAALFGCTAAHFIAYDGPARPSSETAVIYSDGDNDRKVLIGLNEGVSIVMVGDKWIANLQCTPRYVVAVLPGRHYLTLPWGHMNVYAQGKI
jgi:hypothetical protein